MKICLIKPSIVVPAHNQTTMFTPPLGLAYVAGTLKHEGVDVSVIDALGESLDTRHETRNDCYLYGLSPKETVERIPDGADVIGISVGFSFEWPFCRDLAGLVRRRFPKAVIMAGGEHVTAVPERSLGESAIDIGVLGEGEETTLAVARALVSAGFDPAAIQGIAFKGRDGRAVVNERRARKRDIDDIPWPAWDLLPIENYLERGMGFGVNRGRSMPLMASRGCPYRCTFCSNPLMWTTRWIARDPDLLLDEMQHYQNVYGAENFDFYDLTAIIKKSWIVDFCRKIERRGMTFTWQLPSGTRSEAIDDEVAEWLHRSGCRNLSYSPESGSPTVLDRIKKRIKTDAVIASIASSNRRDMYVKCNIIFGFPGETLKEIFQSYWFIVRMAMAGAYDLAIWAFSPYPGSELFEQISKTGRLRLDDAYYDSLRSYSDTSRTVSYSEHIPDRMLKALRWIGTALFYGTSWLRRPTRPFKMVWNILHGRQESRSEMALANVIYCNKLKTFSAGADGA
ncbi:MAG: B12-binding domain-containing radical SAM protein [Rhodospirillales bacterium]|nr:B12-binding domain-containing radical SAM protein [Rhodospirillales bacterium]